MERPKDATEIFAYILDMVRELQKMIPESDRRGRMASYLLEMLKLELDNVLIEERVAQRRCQDGDGYDRLN